MKRFTIIQLLFFIGMIGFPAIGISQIKSVAPVKQINNGPLNWYFKTLSKKGSSGTAVQIASKSRGTMHSYVGVNLPRREQVLTPQGSSNINLTNSGYCESQTFNMDYLNETAFNMVTTNQVFTGVIFPGAFIDARSLIEARPVFYGGTNNRLPLKIGINISNPKTNMPTEITINNFSENINNRLNSDLRDKHFGASIPAQFAYEFKEVKSIEHLTARLNYSAGLMLPLEEFGLPIDLSQGVNATGNTSSTQKMHTYVVSFIQPMYAFSVQEVDPSKFFASAGEAARHPNAGYISSVVYGRMALLTFQSTEDSTSMDALLKARMGITITGGALANAQLGGSISTTVKNNFSSKTSNFKAFIYGGNAGSALPIVNNPDAVFSFIQESNASTLTNLTNALPLQYVVQRLSDGRTIGVRSTSSFAVEDCINPRYDVTVRVTSIKCNKVVEGPLDDAEDIFGSFKVNNTNLFTIDEKSAVSIKKGGTASINGEKKNVASSVTINDIRNLRLTFASALKDWEMLFKPQYREKAPGDMIFTFENKLAQFYELLPGVPKLLDGNAKKSLSLYENGDSNGSHIAVEYQIEITRK